jgi:hypothetical protein
LGEVDVLVFVGKQAVETRRPAVAVIFVAVHGKHRPKQQIAEIGGVGLAEPLLTVRIDANRRAQSRRVDRLAGVLGLGDPGVNPGATAADAQLNPYPAAAK